MTIKMLASILAMLLGFGFAYIQRNSQVDEGIGVYGIILGIIGAVVFVRLNVIPKENKTRDEDGK